MSGLVVAVEGPSDSGKSTLVEGLANRFAGADPLLLPCYVEEAGGDSVVPDYATDPAAQAEALRFYLEMEAQRCRRLRERDPSLALLDRSALSLVAHAYALEQVEGVAVYDAALHAVTTAPEVIIPELALYLDAPTRTRAERSAPGDKGKWFTNAEFNDRIRDFYLDHFPDSAFPTTRHVLDAGVDAAALLETAAEIVSSSLR